MKRLKCIGGAHDGRYFNVEDGYRVGDMVRVASNSLPPLPPPFGDEPIPDEVTIEYIPYTIRALHFARGEQRGAVRTLEYLAPPDMSDEDAVRHQFTKTIVEFAPDNAFDPRQPLTIERRRYRAMQLVGQIFQIIGKYIPYNDANKEPNLKRAHEDLLDAFYGAGVEVVTDQDRINLGLPPRNSLGWTAAELHALEDARLTAMRAPVFMGWDLAKPEKDEGK